MPSCSFLSLGKSAEKEENEKAEGHQNEDGREGNGEKSGKEKRKRVGSKAGTLGVEGMDADLLRSMFRRFETDSLPVRTPITKGDFYLYGLSGGENASALRDKLAENYGLPRGMTANALLGALSILTSREDFEKTAKALQNDLKNIK